jgi:hypothetical protein
MTNLEVFTPGPADIPSSVDLRLDFARDAQGKLALLGDDVVVRVNDEQKRVTLPRVQALFRGDAKAPSLEGEPSARLMPFFYLLEATVLRFCDEDGRDETDQEMERIYSELRRRPDGKDSALRSHLRAAARLYMMEHEVSLAEYEGVMRRLVKSARTFSMPPLSRNYVETLRSTIET